MMGDFAQRLEKVHSSRHAERSSGNTSLEDLAYTSGCFEKV